MYSDLIGDLIKKGAYERAHETAMMVMDELNLRPELMTWPAESILAERQEKGDVTPNFFSAGLEKWMKLLAPIAPPMVEQLAIYAKRIDHAISDGFIARARAIMDMTVDELITHGHPAIKGCLQSGE